MNAVVAYEAHGAVTDRRQGEISLQIKYFSETFNADNPALNQFIRGPRKRAPHQIP
jgi:hypothetical protein